MRARFSPSHIAHLLLLGAFILAFLIGSERRVRHSLRGIVLASFHADHTSNGFLLHVLGMHDGAARLRALYAGVPENLPIAVMLPKGRTDKTLLVYLLNYFAWPREVKLFPVPPENVAASVSALDRTAFGAIFFCALEPPAGMEPVVPIGNDLVMVPRPRRTE